MRRRRCKKNCLLDGGNARVRRQIMPGPPGLMRTGTTASEEATPSADSLDVVRRMVCTDDGEECSHDVREIPRFMRCFARSFAD